MDRRRRCLLLAFLWHAIWGGCATREPLPSLVRGLSSPDLQADHRIPRVIYQTWVSKLVPLGNQIVRSRMLRRNPGYRVVMYDDADIDAFVSLHYKGTDVERAFRKLKVGAARADLWRYLILFREGGFYLDLDSEIAVPLDDNLIRPDDGAVISRETNRHFMCQYFLAFEAGHPILARVIELATRSILDGASPSPSPRPSPPSLIGAASGPAPAPPIDPWLLDPLLFLAGPPVFNRAVDLEARAAFAADPQKPALPSAWNVWDAPDAEVNAAFAAAGVRARLVGTDYAGAIVFKHEYCNEMGWFKLHWRDAGTDDMAPLPKVLICLGVALAVVASVALATKRSRAALAAIFFRGGLRYRAAIVAALIIPILVWVVLRGYIQVIY